MFKIAKPLFLICESPLHAGSGNEVGVVDLPIQREKHTDFPKIESSSLKGAIRESLESNCELNVSKKKYELVENEYTKLLKASFEGLEKEIDAVDSHGNKKIEYNRVIDILFGPEEVKTNNEAAEGSIAISDARILLFPVKTVKNVFAYITCPKVLQKFFVELAQICDIKKFDFQIEEISKIEKNLVPINSGIIIRNNRVILEDYSYEVEKNELCDKIASWISGNVIPKDNLYDFSKKKILTDILVLSNSEFRDFVNHSTEVITRIKINNETGVVEDGALFTEEYLPTESILYSLLFGSPIFHKQKSVFNSLSFSKKEETEKLLSFFKKGLPDIIRIGGNSSIGKGITRVNSELLGE